MKYIVTRTSSDCNSVKPCEEAYKTSVEHWHIRTCTEEHFNRNHAKNEGLWRSSGSDHCRITPSHKITKKGPWIAKREDNREVWAIDINTIEELDRFVSEYGAVVIRNGSNTELS